MMERIQKILSARGVCSRRQAEEMIKAGRVSCNGMICSLGQAADPDVDEIKIDGKLLPQMGEKVYILLHKPRGFVTTLSDEKGRKNVSELVKDCGKRVYPVGRLDMDSEGLLLMTNDGDFANQLMHPSHQIDKVNKVTVSNYSENGVERLKRPVTLDGYTIQPPGVLVLREAGEGSKALLLVTIHEGRNRQVRRMCDIAGMPVQRLIRVQEGPLKLGTLPKGKWRYLTKEEIQAFKK